MATRVGMIRIILGMNRTVKSIRDWTDSRARIGPMIRPRNRSMLVHSPPPATWKKVSAHSELEAMATTRPTRRAATMGSHAPARSKTRAPTEGRPRHGAAQRRHRQRFRQRYRSWPRSWFRRWPRTTPVGLVLVMEIVRPLRTEINDERVHER